MTQKDTYAIEAILDRVRDLADRAPGRLTREQCERVLECECVLWLEGSLLSASYLCQPVMPRELRVDMACYVRAVCDSLDCDGQGVLELGGKRVYAA